MKDDLFSIAFAPRTWIEDAALIAFSAFLDPEITTSSKASPEFNDIEITWLAELATTVCPSNPRELISRVQGKSWSEDKVKLINNYSSNNSIEIDGETNYDIPFNYSDTLTLYPPFRSTTNNTTL